MIFEYLFKITLRYITLHHITSTKMFAENVPEEITPDQLPIKIKTNMIEINRRVFTSDMNRCTIQFESDDDPFLIFLQDTERLIKNCTDFPEDVKHQPLTKDSGISKYALLKYDDENMAKLPLRYYMNVQITGIFIFTEWINPQRVTGVTLSVELHEVKISKNSVGSICRGRKPIFKNRERTIMDDYKINGDSDTESDTKSDTKSDDNGDTEGDDENFVKIRDAVKIFRQNLDTEKYNNRTFDRPSTIIKTNYAEYENPRNILVKKYGKF